MKYELKAADKKEIKEELISHDAIYFKKVKNQTFNVGDILIQKTMQEDDGVWKETVEKYEDSIIPIRYLVIHRDEDSGIHFCKEFLENGKLGSTIYKTFDTDHIQWGDVSYYEVDSSFVDSIIFNEEFDISDVLNQEKNRKTSIIGMNKKSAKVFKTLKEVNKFIESLKNGDIIYFHENSARDFANNYNQPLVIKKTKKITTKKYTKTRGWEWLNVRKGVHRSNLDDKYVQYLSQRTAQGNKLSSAALIGLAIYTTKPVPFTDGETQ